MSSNKSLARLAVRLTGHVQGVGLRGTLSKYCLRRHVTGWMCNTPDRELVLVELQGTQAAIEATLRAVDSYFKDPARCRGMRVEVTGAVCCREGEHEMREVAWAELPASYRDALGDSGSAGAPRVQ